MLQSHFLAIFQRTRYGVSHYFSKPKDREGLSLLYLKTAGRTDLHLLILAQNDRTVWRRQCSFASALLSSRARAEESSVEGNPLSRGTAIHATGTARSRRLEG